MESILDSVKKQLGLQNVDDFDDDIIMQINSAFQILCQLGIGPDDPFYITSSEETYSDFTEDEKYYPMVKAYLFHKTRYGFDPPTGTVTAECLKNLIAEEEWRLMAESELRNYKD